MKALSVSGALIGNISPVRGLLKMNTSYYQSRQERLCFTVLPVDALPQYTQNCDSTLQDSPDRLTVIEEKLARLSDQIESLISHTPNLINVPDAQNTHVQEETQANSKSMNVPVGNDVRKYNAVVYGIPECETGTTKLECVKQDFCRVFDIYSTTVPFSNPNNLICDTIRLGKYFIDLARPRPVLVKFTSTVYVSSNLLNNKKQCPKGITLKPDFPLKPE